MRKLLHHYQKNLTSDGDTDRIEWDLYRLTQDGVESYELKGTITHHMGASYCSPESYRAAFQAPVGKVVSSSLTIDSHDKATGIVVVVTVIPYTTLEGANSGFSEIINRLVSR